MFVQRSSSPTRRSGSEGSRPHGSAVRLFSLAGTGILVAGIAFAAPLSASAAEHNSSAAEGQFLSGSVLGANLDGIVALQPAKASNDGTQSTQEKIDPLGASLLGSSPVDLSAAGKAIPRSVLNTAISGGVLSQYARAEDTGEALGASGTIGADGAIGPNVADGSQGPLTLSFNSLLNDKFASVISDLRLETRAVAAQAKGNPDAVSGNYYIDGLTLKFTSPAVAGLASSVNSSLDPITAQLNALSGANGPLATQLKNLLAAINPALSLTGSSAHLSAAVTSDLHAAVAPLLQASYGGSGVSFNPQNGEVSIDLQSLAGGNLNDKPVGYDVLSNATVTRIISTIASNVSDLGKQIVERVDSALKNAKVDLHADLSLLAEQAPLLGQSCTTVPATPSNPVSGALGGTLNGVLGNLGKTVGSQLCTPTSTLLAPLKTSAVVDVHDTVQQVLTGNAPATVTAQVLGIPISVNTQQLLGPLGTTLTNSLFGSNGGLSTLKNTLTPTMLGEVNHSLLGANSVDTLLSDLLSIKVNLQDTTLHGGGMAVAQGAKFTQTALRVGVADGASGGGLTTLNLAAASVMSDSATGTVTPPDGTGDPGNPGTPGTTGTTGHNHTAAATGKLAYTGVQLAAIVALILALLATGTYLVREGYRRSHPPVID